MALLPVELQLLIEVAAGLWAGVWLAVLARALVAYLQRVIQLKR